MRENRSVCLLLCLAAVLTLLAGCGAAPAPTQPATTTPETTACPTTEATEATAEATEPAVEYAPLALETPAEAPITTVQETVTIQGTVDPSCEVAVCGQTLRPNEDGSFSYEAPLEMGENSLTVEYLGETVTYSVTRYSNVQSYSNADGRTYGAGARMYLEVFARIGSTVTAQFDEETAQSTLTVDQLGSGAWEGYEKHILWFDMPTRPQNEINLGPITYTVTNGETVETFVTGDIICSAYAEPKLSDEEATPAGEGYRNVGSGWIVEVVDCNVETFDGQNSLDKSYPYYNYLPKGTVDYGYPEVITNPDGTNQYMLLRCGVRVYRSIKNTPVTTKKSVVDCYTGTLPDHNTIGFDSLTVQDHFTYLTLDTAWKAPFFFDVEPQTYRDEDTRNLTVEKFDAGYIDIRFCYATEVTSDLVILEDNPLFSHAELTKNESDHTLRLYLKKEGGFYGWHAYYNEKDQLVFKFLNPVTVKPADNAYGADLTGLRIMLDVGHGGIDVGAAGWDKYGVGWSESERNLVLSQKVRERLESIGATVILNRSTMEEMVTQRERIQFLLEQAPDYCLCIHHNSSLDRTRNGYETGYFTTFTQAAADHIHAATEKTGLYKSYQMIWFYYYVSRQTPCPIVLTENGFMSNVDDVANMLTEEALNAKADAMVQGIVNYYLELSGYEINQ